MNTSPLEEGSNLSNEIVPLGGVAAIPEQKNGPFKGELISNVSQEDKSLELSRTDQKETPKPFVVFSKTNNNPSDEGILSPVQEVSREKISSQKSFSLDSLSGSVGSDMETKKIVYFGSPEEAVEDLKKIKNWLGPVSAPLHFEQTTNSLRKTEWYHWFVDERRANQLINSLTEKIIDRGDIIPFKDHEEMKEFLQSVLLPLQRYLSFPLIWRTHDLLEGQRLDECTPQEVELLDFNPTNEKELAIFLKSQHEITLDTQDILGRGGWGCAYSATSKENKYVVKITQRVLLLLDRYADYKKWWRDSDFAASRLDIRNLVKTSLIFIRIQTNDGSRYYALPPYQAKAFGQSPLWKRFLKIDPTAEVSVLAQVMERAPGESLKKILDRGDTLEPGTPLFNGFLNGCCSFVEDTMFANFVHMDIKPDNICFDKEKAVLTLIDTNVSARGARRYRDEEERVLKTSTKEGQPLTNPHFFNLSSGTAIHQPVKVRQGKPYGGEINGERLMILTLQLISREDFRKRKEPRNPKEKSFLLHYLDQLDPNSKTVQALEAHPEIKNLINLTFQLGDIDFEETGKMETIFTQWQEAFHSFQKQYGYKERTDFSAIHKRGP